MHNRKIRHRDCGLRMTGFSENIVEHAGIEMLKDHGCFHLPGRSLALDAPASQRQASSDIILLKRLERAVEALHPLIPDSVHSEAIRKLLTSESGPPVEKNRRNYRPMSGSVRGADFVTRVNA